MKTLSVTMNPSRRYGNYFSGYALTAHLHRHNRFRRTLRLQERYWHSYMPRVFVVSAGLALHRRESRAC